MKLFSSSWAKVFVTAAILIVLIFLSDTAAVMRAREAVFGATRTLAHSSVGAFFFPRAASSTQAGQEDAQKLKEISFEFEALKRENELLKTALDFSRSSGASVKAANVFSYSNELGKESLLIDAGTDAGIARGALVFDSSFFLVGTVVEAGKSVSKVDVASNTGNTFEAQIFPGMARIVAKGMGGGAFLLDLVPIEMPVRKGDFVGFLPKRDIPYARAVFFLGDVVGEAKAQSTIFKTVRAVSPVVPASLTTVFILP